MNKPEGKSNFHLFKTRDEADKKYAEMKHAIMIHSNDPQEKGYWVDSFLTRKYNPILHTIIKQK